MITYPIIQQLQKMTGKDYKNAVIAFPFLLLFIVLLPVTLVIAVVRRPMQRLGIKTINQITELMKGINEQNPIDKSKL